MIKIVRCRQSVLVAFYISCNRPLFSSRGAWCDGKTQLLEAEMDVRHQLVKPTSEAIDTVLGARNSANIVLDDRGKAEVDTKPNTIAVNAISEQQKGMGVPIDSTWIDEVGIRFGTTDGVCTSARYKLRVQMSIEKKRAQFFEDIRMLPYK